MNERTNKLMKKQTKRRHYFDDTIIVYISAKCIVFLTHTVHNTSIPQKKNCYKKFYYIIHLITSIYSNMVYHTYLFINTPVSYTMNSI